MDHKRWNYVLVSTAIVAWIMLVVYYVMVISLTPYYFIERGYGFLVLDTIPIYVGGALVICGGLFAVISFMKTVRLLVGLICTTATAAAGVVFWLLKILGDMSVEFQEHGCCLSIFQRTNR